MAYLKEFLNQIKEKRLTARELKLIFNEWINKYPVEKIMKKRVFISGNDIYIALTALLQIFTILLNIFNFIGNEPKITYHPKSFIRAEN
ncbi:hypothetical protein RhiirC2_754365 [Rhizophagus irregularis]|uniref:Uncharacterized protein n=1 Tax=Rhizophagus irregularis TaxID=588596 RepID=A0A2N1MW50_9GLOM|nr:hypothetical protein RhiirC2_754365 [Rhizophagus irregularis]